MGGCSRVKSRPGSNWLATRAGCSISSARADNCCWPPRRPHWRPAWGRSPSSSCEAEPRSGSPRSGTRRRSDDRGGDRRASQARPRRRLRTCRGAWARGGGGVPDRCSYAAARIRRARRQAPRGERAHLRARLLRPDRSQPSRGLRDRHGLCLGRRGLQSLRHPGDRASEHPRRNERRHSDERSRVQPRPPVLGGGPDERPAAAGGRDRISARGEGPRAAGRLLRLRRGMLALVATDLLPRTLQARTWRAVLGLLTGAAIMLALSAPLGV